MRIWLDDERDAEQWLPGMSWMRGRDVRSEGWVWVRTAPEAIRALEASDVQEVSLDDDLGDAEGVGEGYDALLWVEERVHEDPGYVPPVLHVHSSNLGARGRMEAAMAAIERAAAGRGRPAEGDATDRAEEPETERPFLLVDVDGVVNVPRRGKDRRDDGIEIVFRANEFKIRVPFGIRERIARLEEVFECVWATTWEADAPGLLARRLGFGAEWPVIHFTMGNVLEPTWKLRQVRAWCDENAAGRRVAWLDDDLGPDAEEWAASRPGTLLVRTEEAEGLTEEQTRVLLDWAESG